jgi:hypothetical protein
MKRSKAIVIIECFLLLLALRSLASAQSRPAPLNVPVPPLREANVTTSCVECDVPFDTTSHEQLLNGLAANPYVGELRRALYLQDTAHQFESKAHFDNCDFDSAISYISTLLEETGGYVEKASRNKRPEAKGEVEGTIRSAFFSLGQALHAVQDFYAHSNYVELKISAAKRTDDIEVVEPWTQIGQNRIRQLRNEGLISGFVFWGFPQLCASGTPSHADLAKDSGNTKSGKKNIPHLQNLSQYRIAMFLARQASISLIRYAFERWPLLKEVNGNDIAFEVMLDNRGM